MFMNISIRLNDRFYQLIAFGFGVTYIFQVFLTIGGGTKFIPLTGVTLPLISYGGSSVLTTLMMFAIVEGLYVLRQKEIEEQMLLKRRRRPGSPNGATHRRPTTGRPERRKVASSREDAWIETPAGALFKIARCRVLPRGRVD